MMEAVELLGYVCTACAILVALVGVQICWRIIKKGSPGDISIVPFLAMFISASLWFKYGLMKNIFGVIVVNAVSIMLQFSYICIYFVYSLQKNYLYRHLLITSLIVLSPLMYIHYVATDMEIAASYLGTLCCMTSMISYASPLASLSQVYRTKSTDSMSYVLSLANVIVAVEWCLYGWLLADVYVMFPNLLGFVVSVFQLWLFYKFPSKPTGVAVM